MEVSKADLLEAVDVLKLDPEKLEAIDEQSFQVVPTSQLREALAQIRNLTKDNKLQRDELDTLVNASIKLGSMLDFSSPMKAAAGIMKVVNNPKKYANDLEPVIAIYNKYNDKQIEDGKAKKG